MIELTILMPCLNEAATVANCIEKAKAFLARADVAGEIIISDNGSVDGSQAIAIAQGAKVINATEKGYGAAIIAGIAAARGRYVIVGDSDDSYNFSNLDSFVDSLRCGNQLVMGNRFDGGIAVGAMPALHRYLGNPALSGIGRLFFRSKIRDFHCGLRGFDRESILKLSLSATGMEFASEMIVKATLKGFRIAEVPTTLQPDGRGRPPHLRSWQDGWRHLKFLLIFCPRWLFIYPGAALFMLGMTSSLLIRHRFLEFSFVGFGVHSLLYAAAATILGVQLVQLGMLTLLMSVKAGIGGEPKWLTRLKPYTSLEIGLILGAALIFTGIAWTIGLIYAWSATGFGALNPEEIMHAAIPSTTLMIIGFQACAGTLFASAISYYWRQPVPVIQP